MGAMVEETLAAVPSVAGLPYKHGRQKFGAKLRMQAMLAYVLHQDGISLAQMRELPQFNHVPLQRLEIWSRKDRWGARRRQIRQEAYKLVVEKSKRSFAKELEKQLDDLRIVYKRGQDLLANVDTLPKSWEGLASTFMQIGKRLSDLEREIQSFAESGQMPGSASVGSVGGLAEADGTFEFTVEEVRIACRAALRAKRLRIRGEPPVIEHETQAEPEEGQGEEEGDEEEET